MAMLLTVLPSAAQQNDMQTRAEEPAYAEHSVLAKGKWAKIQVSETGICRITPAVVSAAGFSDINKVKVYGYGGAMIPEILTQEYLRNHDDLKEIATCQTTDGKYFFAAGPVSWNDVNNTQRVRNPYSNYGYYFLTQDDGAPLTCTEAELLEQANTDNSHFYTLYENDKFAWSQTGRNLFDGKEIKAGKSSTFDVVIPAVKGDTIPLVYLTCITSAGATSSFSVSAGDTIRNHSLNFIDYDVARIATTNFNLKPKKIENHVRRQADGSFLLPVTIECKSGGPLRLDYIQVHVKAPVDVPSLASGNYPTVEFVEKIKNQDHHADAVVDNLIIIPTSQKLRAQAEELGELHSTLDGMSYRIIPANELYNEFSSGTPDLSAYRRYLKMFYDKADGDATKMPKHVILFGDAVWDHRMNTLSSASYSVDDYLLTYEPEDSYSTLRSYATDDFITILKDGKTVHSGSNSDKTLTFDIAVGRIPVTTDALAKKVVEKIKHYVTSSPAGEWQNEIMFIGDDGDAHSHMANINANADSVIYRSPGYHVKKMMADAYKIVSTSVGDRLPELSAAVKKQQNDGALVMNYGGHASWNELAHEQILTQSDFSNFRGSNYSLWFTAACETVPFDGTAATIGEEALLNANGGSIAFMGTTRTVVETNNSRMNIAFMRHLLSYDEVETDGVKRIKPVTIGEAQRRAKNSLVSSVTSSGQDRTLNKHNYVLIGDPAMHLALPEHKVVIDSINGISTADDVAVVAGNSIVRVKGHVQDYSKEPLQNFNGKAHVIVRDSKQKKITLNHDGDSKPFTYEDRTSTLYKGTCSVVDGEFSFTFRVPQDIYNDGRNAMITVYAIDENNKMAANGESEGLSVQGWEDVKNDSVGPSLYCYLNTTSFRNGDAVGRTPFFVAEISDEDGINTTGSAIGHNLELIVDGKATQTYDLNDNFQFDYGSYTSGQTYFVLPELEVGTHSLTFKAWDLLNNSNTVTLDFRVVKGMQPTIGDVRISPNPVKGEATFYVNHDMRGSSATVVIEILNTSGNLVQVNEWNDVLSEKNGTSQYRWSSIGMKPGMYLYRVRISCDGSSYVSKSKKLIVAQ